MGGSRNQIWVQIRILKSYNHNVTLYLIISITTLAPADVCPYRSTGHSKYIFENATLIVGQRRHDRLQTSGEQGDWSGLGTRDSGEPGLARDISSVCTLSAISSALQNSKTQTRLLSRKRTRLPATQHILNPSAKLDHIKQCRKEIPRRWWSDKPLEVLGRIRLRR
jgi:hypothetical protein